ncbi:hypothetical protein FI667_g1466, partial [Globisporangium splendens]
MSFLALSTHTSCPPFLTKTIEIANVMLADRRIDFEQARMRKPVLAMSPSKFDNDVGNHMETMLLGGLALLQIQKSTTAISYSSNSGTWTEDMPILNAVIQKSNGTKVIREDHLSKFFAPGTPGARALFPVELEPCSNEGATVHHCSGRKHRRTPPTDPNTVIPDPLCGISKDRNAKRKRCAED